MYGKQASVREGDLLKVSRAQSDVEMKEGLILLVDRPRLQEAYRDATKHQSQFAASFLDKSETLLLIYGPLMACQYMDPLPSPHSNSVKKSSFPLVSASPTLPRASPPVIIKGRFPESNQPAAICIFEILISRRQSGEGDMGKEGEDEGKDAES
ncbi:uncharacterized protein V6R79_005376 [Siganus canaliculatus]